MTEPELVRRCPQCDSKMTYIIPTALNGQLPKPDGILMESLCRPSWQRHAALCKHRLLHRFEQCYQPKSPDVNMVWPNYLVIDYIEIYEKP